MIMSLKHTTSVGSRYTIHDMTLGSHGHNMIIHGHMRSFWLWNINFILTALMYLFMATAN